MTALAKGSWDRLADALAYPEAQHAAVIEDCRRALTSSCPAAAEWVSRFAQDTKGLPLSALQELYTETFDLDPARTLDLSWHVFGEGYERGAFLATLRHDLRTAGVQETTELPDHVTHVLRLIGRVPEPGAGEFAAFAGAALDRVLEGLKGSANPYEFLIRAVLETLRHVHVDRCEPHEGD